MQASVSPLVVEEAIIVDAEALVSLFVEKMAEAFGGNIKSIVLCGSYARGDQTENSDMDMYCFFEKCSPEDLIAIGKIVGSFSPLYPQFELNVQCMTVDEYARQGFGRAFVTPIKYFESKVVYGEDLGVKPSREDFYPLFEDIISETVMSIRHYITAQEPAQRLADGRLKRWALKPLCVALRIERFIITGAYPHHFKELLEMSVGLPQVKAVEWMISKEQFTRDITTSPTDVLIELLDIAAGVSERVANYKEGRELIG